jgi:hypothetical protein
MGEVPQPFETAPLDSGDDIFTLLGVRSDGIASFVDLMAADSLLAVRSRAQWLLKEHASCRVVEVWLGGSLLEECDRG